MAIAQSRVIDLIHAGMDYQQALNTLISHVHTHFARVKASEMSAEAALEYLFAFASEDTLLKHINSPNIISMEHRHFYTNSKRNAQRAQIAALRRRAEGKPERNLYQPNAPIIVHINPTPHLPQPSVEFETTLSPSEQAKIRLEMEVMEKRIALQELAEKDARDDAAPLDLPPASTD